MSEYEIAMGFVNAQIEHIGSVQKLAGFTPDSFDELAKSMAGGAVVAAIRATRAEFEVPPEDLSRRDETPDYREAWQYYAERAHDRKHRELNGE